MQAEALILPTENLETIPVYQIPEKESFISRTVENKANDYITNSLANVNKPQVKLITTN